jgi:hypothetical protein
MKCMTSTDIEDPKGMHFSRKILHSIVHQDENVHYVYWCKNCAYRCLDQKNWWNPARWLFVSKNTYPVSPFNTFQEMITRFLLEIDGSFLNILHGRHISETQLPWWELELWHVTHIPRFSELPICLYHFSQTDIILNCSPQCGRR